MAFIEVARITLPPEGPFSKERVWWEDVAVNDDDKVFSYNTFFSTIPQVKTVKLAFVRMEILTVGTPAGDRVGIVEMRDASDQILVASVPPTGHDIAISTGAVEQHGYFGINAVSSTGLQPEDTFNMSLAPRS